MREFGAAGEAHGHFEFSAEDFDHTGDAECAADGESVHIRTADHDCRSAEGEGLEDVDAATDAAVENQRHAFTDSLGDGGQGIDTGLDGVEAAAAVVGDDEAVTAEIDGSHGIARMQHALEQQWHINE